MPRWALPGAPPPQAPGAGLAPHWASLQRPPGALNWSGLPGALPRGCWSPLWCLPGLPWASSLAPPGLSWGPRGLLGHAQCAPEGNQRKTERIWLSMRPQSSRYLRRFMQDRPSAAKNHYLYRPWHAAREKTRKVAKRSSQMISGGRHTAKRVPKSGPRAPKPRILRSFIARTGASQDRPRSTPRASRDPPGPHKTVQNSSEAKIWRPNPKISKNTKMNKKTTPKSSRYLRGFRPNARQNLKHQKIELHFASLLLTRPSKTCILFEFWHRILQF